jgi:hypothetical protein
MVCCKVKFKQVYSSNILEIFILWQIYASINWSISVASFYLNDLFKTFSRREYSYYSLRNKAVVRSMWRVKLYMGV